MDVEPQMRNVAMPGSPAYCGSACGRPAGNPRIMRVTGHHMVSRGIWPGGAIRGDFHDQRPTTPVAEVSKVMPHFFLRFEFKPSAGDRGRPKGASLRPGEEAPTSHGDR